MFTIRGKGRRFHIVRYRSFESKPTIQQRYSFSLFAFKKEPLANINGNVRLRCVSINDSQTVSFCPCLDVPQGATFAFQYFRFNE